MFRLRRSEFSCHSVKNLRMMCMKYEPHLPGVRVKEEKTSGIKYINFVTGKNNNWMLGVGVLLVRRPLIWNGSPSNEREREYLRITRHLAAKKNVVNRVNLSKLNDDISLEKLIARNMLEQDLIERINSSDEDSLDLRDFQRLPKRSLHCLLKPKYMNPNEWFLPSGVVLKESALNEVANEIIKRFFSEDLGHKFFCVMPSCYTKVKFPSDHDYSNHVGAKVMIYKSYYMQGEVNLNPELSLDHSWLTREEVAKYLSPKTYNDIKFLLNE